MGSAAGVDSLDPARTYYIWVSLLQRMLSRTPMAYPSGPGPASRLPVPDLLAEPPATADRRVWTLTLRSGVAYDDGTTVTADHLRHAIERTYDPGVTGGLRTIHALLAGTQGYGGPAAGEHLDCLRVEDPQTLTVTLAAPFADFPHVLAQPALAPVPPQRDTYGGYERSPAWSGPYRVTRHDEGRALELRRNPYWDPGSDPVRPALLDGVDVRLGLEHHEVDEAVLRGELDLSVEGRGVQLATQEWLARDDVLMDRVDNPATGFLQFVSIHPFVEPFDCVHVRRAVQHAVDRVDLQRARGGPALGGDIATELFPPTFAAHRPWERYGTGPDRRGDLDAARAELARSRHGGRLRGRIATQRGKFHDVAESLAASVARVGIELEVVDLDIATYFSQGVGHPRTLREQGLGLAVTDWGADYPTEHGFLTPLVDGRMIRRGGGNWNLPELDDPEIHRLVDEAVAGDAPAALAAWREVEARVMEHAVLLPVVHDRTVHVRGPRLTNVYVHPAFGLYDVHALGLEESP
ncbi:ABC transporter substrate-binding protein [uncultured Phycicoccus sp.]|uniref:ABC transporter substrate-binding protein n=1 Tax=uncultured Phycicoccus sp. TaxID=661422 RepID=UPI0026104773|nr:ABC transporter substrate-binding protein [uncultured Phycicoccus sp.]